MARLTWQDCCESVKKDVINSSKHALYVVLIHPDNQNFSVLKNKNPKLSVISILGPGILNKQGRQKAFPKALLTEIGVSATRPYHRSKGISWQSGQPKIPQRKNWFQLTKEQYLLIAPILFKLIQILAEKRVAGWKNKKFWLETNNNFYKIGKLESSINFKEWTKGARFSFNKKDELLLSDLYWAENQNPQVILWIEKLPKFISKRLSVYQYPKYKGKKPFSKLKGAQDILERTYLKKLLPHLQYKVIENISHGKNNPFYHDLQTLLNLTNYKQIEEKLIQKAEKLNNPEQRTQEIVLKIISGFENHKRDYIVFEVFPEIDDFEEKIPF